MKSLVGLGVAALIICSSCQGPVYVFNGNPFSGGPLVSTSFVQKDAGIPDLAEVFYPQKSGSYAVIFFVPGLYALIPPQLYSSVLLQLAEHGYIVLVPSADLPKVEYGSLDPRYFKTLPNGVNQKLWDTYYWFKDNLNNLFESKGISVKADWNYVGMAGHSAGADTVLEMIMNDNSVSKAMAYLEPFTASLLKPFNGSVPSLVYGAQFCEEKPRCCITGFDYVHVYNNIPCPRITMNATGFGHCDILNDIGWDLCHDLHFCKTVTTNDRVLYKRFVSGLMAAFFGYYVQGNDQQLQYLLKANLMPIPVTDLKSDLNC